MVVVVIFLEKLIGKLVLQHFPQKSSILITCKVIYARLLVLMKLYQNVLTSNYCFINTALICHLYSLIVFSINYTLLETVTILLQTADCKRIQILNLQK